MDDFLNVGVNIEYDEHGNVLNGALMVGRKEDKGVKMLNCFCGDKASIMYDLLVGCSDLELRPDKNWNPEYVVINKI